MAAILLDIEGLRVRRGARTVLHDVRLRVARGEVCGLLGPNGAGKTATIAAALGLLAPDAGRVRLLGEDPLAAPDALRVRVGLVPERDGLTGWMDAADYLQYWAVLQDRPIGQRGEAALLGEFGLEDLLGMAASRYSQGMRRRLAVARALVADPDLLILDEPTNGLDPRGRRQLFEAVRRLARGRGVGVLLCTRMLEDVERTCDRIAVLVEGRTVAEGVLPELLARVHGRRYRLRLAGPIPQPNAPAGGAAPLRVLRRGHDDVLVELGSGLPPETAWRTLFLAGWPIQEVRAERSRLEELYSFLTEAAASGAPGTAAPDVAVS